MVKTLDDLRWHKFRVLDNGFVTLVDVMGTDSDIVQAARISYNKDSRDSNERYVEKRDKLFPNAESLTPDQHEEVTQALKDDERKLIRHLMRHRHTTPFEMVELKFLVRVPMDCWRQWIRHRTANVNEYSTRYTEAIDEMQTTAPDEWRLQSGLNKQGSDGMLSDQSEGVRLSRDEALFQDMARDVYKSRLDVGIAREQARKDLPLSTYTEAYWKIDLHNLLNFLGLRMDAHAQLEIRQYATIIGEQIAKPLFPMVWEAFEDYRLDAMYLTRLDKLVIQDIMARVSDGEIVLPIPDGEETGTDSTGNQHTQPAWMDVIEQCFPDEWTKPRSREREEFLQKLRNLGILL